MHCRIQKSMMLPFFQAGLYPPNLRNYCPGLVCYQSLSYYAKLVTLFLIDTPSVLAVPDALTLAPLSDGVVLVVSRGKTRVESVQKARKQLEDVKAKMIGVVVNRTDSHGSYDYYQKRMK